ncbi:MAG: DUF763 domain-containing protein [Candidatus Aenigmatarchaeota archaeon]|nr:MAG: DUF763 domain-containing protein [Candidatus Aenigmarchaeota archaeon]
MERTGFSDLPLHYGKAPSWLFQRMVKLSKNITQAIVFEYGEKEFLKRLSNPFWFQAFGCVLGFDWHSSGLTTTVTGALKEALSPETGICVAGGKGKASRTTLFQIEKAAETVSLSENKLKKLKHASRMSAKIDNTCVQDGYKLYHHVIFFTEKGEWCVVQQGLNPEERYARRYHWFSENMNSWVNEPHTGIVCDKKGKRVLDLTAKESKDTRKTSVDLVKEKPEKLLTLLSFQTTLDFPFLKLPKTHEIREMRKINIETLRKAYEFQPENYEELVSLKGIGPKTIRALALISELIYGDAPSWKDPAKFSFSHGGKDRIPYPVDKETYDKSIEILETGIQEAKIRSRERLQALKRLKDFIKF